MAAAGARAQKPVGSAAWISTEKENSMQLVNQEMEEIEFPVRYEMEWLNEHMAEVFSNNQFNFADVFKTPGKLRGKTPRTIRKRDATENRVPLSEIFSSVKKNRANSRLTSSPTTRRSPLKATAAPSVPTPPAQTKDNTAKPPETKYPDLTQNLNSFSQYNTDSGYHGMSQDDDEVVLTQVAPESQQSTQPMDIEPIAVNEVPRGSSVDRRTTDASFHSARERGATVEPTRSDPPEQTLQERTPLPGPTKENEAEKDATKEDTPANDNDRATVQEAEEGDVPTKEVEPSPAKPANVQPSSPPREHNQPETDDIALDNLDDISSPSDNDSPERPPIRKSSLSFASLPAREPLASKSLGGSRISRTSHVELLKANPAGSSNYFGRQTGHRMTQALDESVAAADKMEIDEAKETSHEESDVDAKATKLHNKSSTQRLHEKIIAGLSSAQTEKRESSMTKPRTTTPVKSTANAEDDWIKPFSSPLPKASEAPTSDGPERPTSPQSKPNETEVRDKSATPSFSSPQRFGHQKSASVNVSNNMTTTPIGSPSQQDGPLSASKSRLHGAAVSTAARVEASPDQPKAHSQRPLSVFSPPRQEGRRTRSSTEREERRKQQELEERKREEELAEKARQAEKSRAHTESEARNTALPSTLSSSPSRGPQSKASKELETVEDVGSKAAAQPAPTREPQQKPKPQPVSIRVGSALSRQMPLTSSVETSIPAQAPPPSASKQPPSTLKKKASNSSLHTAPSTSSFKSSLASERKREQEEREARRKEEQRRELERKRAAQQQEEARRQEMRSRAEAERRERLEDPKKAAQMQAIEKRRLENARRLERQGSQQPEEKTAPASQRETSVRPPSRLGSVLGRPINQPAPNPAKPPKRGLDEAPNHRAATAKPGAMQPSGETKRKFCFLPRCTCGCRVLTSFKEPGKKPSMYGAGQHSAAPQPGSSIFKTAQPQRPGHPMDMAKYTSGKIPFAEPANAGPSQPHRTPGASSSKAPRQPSPPNYPNGENINLPEIATDSEDEDSEAEMLPVPKWAQPKELETLLREQEGLEADSIFGPIAPFSLEETFKSDKRIKKFRERTSSANWAGPDGLTQDEIRKDIAERQRLRLNGGWTFGM
ncbi:hypothetical protein BJX61DRAFT_532153 [Aspergillus egyptiacus]|nr:hypothetical protein BJX61DRAFT_532153 [Aspergillus egyptiacus]